MFQNCYILNKNNDDPDFLKKVITGPADFFLFPKMKTPMKLKRFARIEEIKEKVAVGDTKKHVSEVFRGFEKMLA